MLIHFPDYWDSNWLSINTEIKDFQNNLFYDNSDNCLLTIELVKLKEWLSNLKNILMKLMKFILWSPSYRLNLKIISLK